MWVSSTVAVQGLIARDHRTHQHIGATAGVLGERLHGNVHTQIKRVEGNARAPGVVEHGDDGALSAATLVGQLHTGHQRRNVGELQRDGARRFQPDESRGRRDVPRQVFRVHGVEKPVRDAPGRQLDCGERLAGTVSVVGDEHFVTAAQEGHVDQRHGRQTAGHQHTVFTTFDGGDALFQREGGRRSVQAVGVAALVFPVVGAQRFHVGEKDGGRLVHTRRHRLETFGGFVGMVDQAGGQVFHERFADGPPQGETRPLGGQRPAKRRSVGVAISRASIFQAAVPGAGCRTPQTAGGSTDWSAGTPPNSLA